MTDFKTSTILESQFPEYIRKDGQKLIAFMKAYYEWMEKDGNVHNETKNLINYQDIDTTTDKYIDFFLSEVADSFPDNVLSDKKLLAKNIKDFYLSKGSEESYKLLFRILYDDDIDFFYPGEFILRASDGRWVEESSLRTSIRVSGEGSGDLTDFEGQQIVGADSNTTAKVTRVVRRIEVGIPIFELFIEDVVGTFNQDETISTVDGSVSADIVSSIGPIQDVTVDSGALGYTIGDAVNFVADDGVGANGVVTEIDSTTIEFILNDGGSGYQTNSTIIFGPSSGTGASFTIDSISNTEVVTTYDDQIICISNTVIGANSFGTSNSCSISSNLAISNSSSTIESSLGTTNAVYGTINSISTTSGGTGYGTLLPTVTVREDEIADLGIDDGSGGIKGLNADIEAKLVSNEDQTGRLIDVEVNERGQGYLPLQLKIVNATNTAVADSLGTPTITGIVDYPGKYIDTKGWLSWNNVLQDNLYYQEFSYEIISDEFINAYRKLVNRIVHPSGTKLFGRVGIEDEFAANTTTLSVDSETTIVDYAFIFIDDGEFQ